MARGVIFEITKEKDEVGAMSETDFYDKLTVLSASYVKDMDMDESAIDINILIEKLAACGLSVETVNGSEPVSEMDGKIPMFYEILPADEAKLKEFKKSWFHSRFEEFKAQADAITEDGFTEESAVHTIMSLLEDDYDDCVYLNSGFGMTETMAMDSFIRGMEPDCPYYLSPKTVLMH